MAMSVAELKRKRAALLQEMRSIIEKEDDDTPLGDDDRGRLDGLEKAVKEHDDRIERLEAFNVLSAKEADPVEVPDDNEERAFAPVVKSNVVIKRKQAAPAPGLRVARFMIGTAVAKAAMSWNAAARFVDQAFGDDEVTKALNSTTPSTGGALVPQDFVAELIPLLYAKSTVRKSGARVIPAPNGNLTIPRQNAGATATYVGELDQIPTSQQGVDDIQMTAKKLVALTPSSMDLVRRSPISVEALVRDDLVQQLGLKEDISFLTGSGSGGVPKGLSNWAGTSLTMTSSLTLASVTAALRNMELSLVSNNVPMENVVWVWHPAIRMYLSTITDSVGRFVFDTELNQGSLFGYKFFESNQLPTNLGGGTNETQIFMYAAPEVIIADTLNMFVDSSMEATYIDGSSATISAYQTDRILFRAITEHDIAVRHPAAVCINQVRSWFPSGYTGTAGAAYSTQAADTDPSGAGSTPG